MHRRTPGAVMTQPGMLESSAQSDQDGVQTSVSDGIKWLNEIGSHRQDFLREVERQCDKKCCEGLQSCSVVKELQGIHKDTACKWAK